MAKAKISIVRYLNAVPLAWGILEGPQAQDFETVLSTPAECADQLAAGTVDIGLIPSIEYHRIPGAKVVPGPVIACRHRVRSVLLVSQKPLWQVKTVAFDRGSRSSVVLAQILFDEFHHIRPDFMPSDPDLPAMLAKNDAALIIGDKALAFTELHERPDAAKQKDLLRLSPEPLYVFDLVERWKVLTGLPFVFAFWAVRNGFEGSGAVKKLMDSREYGRAHIPEIAERYSGELGIGKELVRQYLTDNVSYYMDDDCLEGLRMYYEKAARIGALKSSRVLEFL